MIQTDEILLKVVAQFIFRPGSGQPTLLWLDSVHTVRSTNQYDDHTSVGIVDPQGEFMQFTRELGEGSTSRSWTTFFPPKIADITSGRGSLGVVAGACLSAESQRSEFLRKKLEGGSFEQAGMAFNGVTRGPPCEINGLVDGQQRGILRGEDKSLPENGCAPAAPNEVRDGVMVLVGDPDEQGGDKIIPKDDKRDDRIRGKNGSAGNLQREHFTLPTEAWAHRSTVGRGLYFSRTGGAGGYGDRPLTEQWPRKRSTGTTMRPDGPWNRMDLRSAAENNHRPWSSPMDHPVGTGNGMAGGPVGVLTRRLTCTNG